MANLQQVVDAIQPLADQWEQSRILTDLQGQGLATEAQRTHLNQQNDLLDEGCADNAYLIISRSLESRAINKTWSKQAFTQVAWTPLAFTAALHAAGALDTAEARAVQRYIKNAITGSVTNDERAPMDRDKVCETFWTTVKQILSSDYMPVLVARAAGAQGNPPAETPVQLYTRRVRTAFRANFFSTFDGFIKWVEREKKMRDDTETRIAAIEAARASDRADFQNRINQIKNNSTRAGNKNTQNNNANNSGNTPDKTPPGNKNQNGNRPSVLDAYNDPENPNRERSPRRSDPKEKLVCKFYVAGKKGVPCESVAKGGSCPHGRHGGSFRRIQYINVKENCGLSHAEVPPGMRPPSQDANCNLEISRDFQRSYGSGSVLPECVRKSIHFQKAHDSSQLKSKSKQVAKRLLALCERFKDVEADEHSKFPPHMQRVYREKSFLLLEHLAAEAVDQCEEVRPRKAEVMSLFRKFKEGLPTRGEISTSGFWRLLPTGDVQDKKDTAVRVSAEPERRRPAQHWAPDEDIIEINRQTDLMIESGLWVLIDEKDWGETSSAATVFPVWQRGKVRLCCDMRHSNLMMWSAEKMRLLGVRAAIEIIGRCMSCFHDQPALRQYKSDLAADFDAERRYRLRTREAIEEQTQQEIRSDLEYSSTTILSDQQRGHLDTELEDEAFAFTPLGGKKDMASYYYQYAVDSPSRNRLWIPGARTGRRDAAGNSRRSWRQVKSFVALFGSLSRSCADRGPKEARAPSCAPAEV
eukprot:g16095.t1